MNGMLARLEESQAAQRRFVSDASHELKSPLASLRQYAEVARAHPDRISAAELSDAVLDEGARLERLVQGMLVLSRADEGGLALHVADVDLDDLLLAEATRLRAAGSCRRRRERQCIPSACAATSVCWRQVTRNLADNAARHARTSVRFGVTRVAAGAMLTIEDDGAGIAAADRDRVFERFVRLDEARARDAGGSGLGLAIVREIVRAHGGDVRVDAGASGGARFVVSLPALTDSIGLQAGFRGRAGSWSPTQEDTMRKPIIWITTRRRSRVLIAGGTAVAFAATRPRPPPRRRPADRRRSNGPRRHPRPRPVGARGGHRRGARRGRPGTVIDADADDNAAYAYEIDVRLDAGGVVEVKLDAT